MNTKEVRNMIKYCKKNGVSRIKFGDVEIDFTESIKTQGIKNYATDKMVNADSFVPLSDEEIKYAEQAELDLANELLAVEDPQAWEEMAMGEGN